MKPVIVSPRPRRYRPRCECGRFVRRTEGRCARCADLHEAEDEARWERERLDAARARARAWR